MKQLLSVLTAVVMLSLGACAPKSQSSCGFVQNVYGERISWKGEIPVKMYIHRSVPHEYRAGIYAAARTWENSAGKQLFQIVESAPTNVIGQSTIDSGAIKDNFNVITFESVWDKNKKSEQARTSLYWKGDQIQEADIKVNTQDFNFYLAESNGGYQVNFEALMLHEMGHVLGLKHKDNSPSVMATYLPSNTDRVSLGNSDSIDLKCEY